MPIRNLNPFGLFAHQSAGQSGCLLAILLLACCSAKLVNGQSTLEGRVAAFDEAKSIAELIALHGRFDLPRGIGVYTTTILSIHPPRGRVEPQRGEGCQR